MGPLEVYQYRYGYPTRDRVLALVGTGPALFEWRDAVYAKHRPVE